MSRIIEVLVSPTGETNIKTRGFSGSDCQQASKFLEQALGVTTTETKTAEYYAQADNEQHIKQE